MNKLKRDELAENYMNENVELSGKGTFFDKREASYHSFKSGYDSGYAEAQELLKEFRKYARHNHSCDAILTDKSCDCGFNNLIEQYKRASE